MIAKFECKVTGAGEVKPLALASLVNDNIIGLGPRKSSKYVFMSSVCYLVLEKYFQSNQLKNSKFYALFNMHGENQMKAGFISVIK